MENSIVVHFFRKGDNMYDIAIVGSGPAGISAAVNAKIRNKSVIIFGNDELSHKVEISRQINNYIGFANVTGTELNDAFRKHLKDLEIEITPKRITGVYKMKDKFTLLANRESFEAKCVILALGSETVKPITNERELLGRGVSYCATCDGMFYKGRSIAVFCDNENMLDEVEYLSQIAKKVYLFAPFDVKTSVENVEILPSKITEIIGENKVEAVTLKDGRRIEVDGVFFLKQAVSADVLLFGLKTENGSISVNRKMQTNIDGCFAAGDCTGTPYQIAKAVGEGNIAAHSAFEYLAK